MHQKRRSPDDGDIQLGKPGAQPESWQSQQRDEAAEDRAQQNGDQGNDDGGLRSSEEVLIVVQKYLGNAHGVLLLLACTVCVLRMNGLYIFSRRKSIANLQKFV